MDVTKTIKDLRGREVTLSNPTQKEIDALPKNEQGEPDISKLPFETIRNVILTCLTVYPVQNKKEIFYINTIANLVLSQDAVDLKEKFKDFLVDVLKEQIIRKRMRTVASGKKEEEIIGMYYGWALQQVLDELGIEPEIEEEES